MGLRLLGAAPSGARFWRRARTSSMLEKVAKLVTTLANNILVALKKKLESYFWGECLLTLLSLSSSTHSV